MLKVAKTNLNITGTLIPGIAAGVLLFKVAIMLWALNRGIDLVDESFNFLLLNSPHQYSEYMYATLLSAVIPVSLIGKIWALRFIYFLLELATTAILFSSAVLFIKNKYPAIKPVPVLAILFFALAVFNGRIENYINYHTATAQLVNIVWALILLAATCKRQIQTVLHTAAYIVIAFVFTLKLQSAVFVFVLTTGFVYYQHRSIKLIAIAAFVGTGLGTLLLLSIQPFKVWHLQAEAFTAFTKAMGYLSWRFPLMYLYNDLLPLAATLLAAIAGYKLLQKFGNLTACLFFLFFSFCIGAFTLYVTQVPCGYFLIIYGLAALFIALRAGSNSTNPYFAGLLFTPILLGMGSSSFIFEIAIASASLWLAATYMLVAITASAHKAILCGIMVAGCVVHFSIARIILPCGFAKPLWCQNTYNQATGQYVDEETAAFVFLINNTAAELNLTRDARVINTLSIMGINHIMGVALPPQTPMWCFAPFYLPQNQHFFNDFPDRKNVGNTFIVSSANQEPELFLELKNYLSKKHLTVNKVAQVPNILCGTNAFDCSTDSINFYRVVTDAE